jgi:hypothetical protein
MVFPPLAFIDPGTLALMIPILALCIPIVAILSGHQQKMAAIIHGASFGRELEELKREIAQLQSTVYEQQRSLDRMNSAAILRSGQEGVSTIQAR